MFSTFHRHSSTGYRIGSMSTARTNPEAEPRLTALTATVPLSSTSEYSVCFWIFSKVSGSQESGKGPPALAAENFPISRVTGDSAQTITAKFSSKAIPADPARESRIAQFVTFLIESLGYG